MKISPAYSLTFTTMATADKAPGRTAAERTHPGINITWGHSSLMGKSMIREPFTSRRSLYQISHLVPLLLIIIQAGKVIVTNSEK